MTKLEKRATKEKLRQLKLILIRLNSEIEVSQNIKGSFRLGKLAYINNLEYIRDGLT